jgi:Mn-dependent DtxR family transcriptional regulator
MPTVVASLLTDTAKEEMTKARRSDEDRVLQVLDDCADASFADVAAKLNWLTAKGGPNKSKVQRAVERLHRNKLLNKDRDRYELTAKGKKVLKKE